MNLRENYENLKKLILVADKYETFGIIEDYCKTNSHTINDMCIVDSTNIEDRSPLFFIAVNNLEHRVKIAQILIDYGADINLKGDSNPILHYTAGMGDLAYIKMLLENGAKLDFPNNRFTALFYAVANKHNSAAKMLLEYDAKPIDASVLLIVPHIDYYKLAEKNIALLNTKN